MQVVSRVDHVTILSDDAESVFGALRRALGVPVLWPFMNLGPMRFGALYLGNCALHVMTLDAAPEADTRMGGVAFVSEHDPWQLAARMKRLGLKHTPPARLGMAAAHGLEWSWSHVGGLIESQPRMRYLGGWLGGASPYAKRQAAAQEAMSTAPRGIERLTRSITDQMATVVAYHSIEPARRLAAAQRAFDESGGGPHGLAGVGSVDFTLRQWSGRERAWSKLLGIQVSHNTTAFLSSGPAIRFREGPKDRLAGITLKTQATRDAMPRDGRKIAFNDAVLKALDLPIYVQTTG